MYIVSSFVVFEFLYNRLNTCTNPSLTLISWSTTKTASPGFEIIGFPSLQSHSETGCIFLAEVAMSRESFSSLSCWRIPRKICCNKNSSRSFLFVFKMVSCLWFIWLLKKSSSKMWIVYWFALRSSLKWCFMFPMIGRQSLSVKQILLMNLFWWSNLLMELFWISSFMIENLFVRLKTSIRLSRVGWSTLLMIQIFMDPWERQIGFSP